MSSLKHDEFTDTNSISVYHNENQDSILAEGQNFAVADGVGGYEGGKIASKMCVGLLHKKMELVSREEDLKRCVIEIHEEILEKARELGHPMMGTTLATCRIFEDRKKVLSANVGDSPIFLVRGTSARALHFEDSERSNDPYNMWTLTQYLGFPEKLSVHTSMIDYSNGDILLLCSDGVSDNILAGKSDPGPIAEIVNTKKSAKGIVKAAIERNLKRDDMSAVLVFL